MTTVTTDRKALLCALAAVMPATSRSAFPRTAAVRIGVDAGACSIQADNLDLALTVSLDAQVAGRQSSVVVNARKLAAVVRRGLPAGEITIDLGPKRPSVAGGTTKVWLDPRSCDWPTHAPVTGETIRLGADDVATIKRAAVVASDDWARPILHSVFVGDGYTVATDSYRLIAATIKAAPAKPILLPVELVKVLPTDGVELTVGGDAVSWAGGWSRLVTGEFPKWQPLMPAAAPAPLVLDRPAFLAAVLRAEAVIAASAGGGPPVVITPAPGGISLGARYNGEDLFSDQVDGTAGGVPIALTARYLAQALRSIDSARVRLSIVDPLQPILITADADDADTFRHLLMPVRLS